MFFCPICNATLHDGTRWCRHCGHNIAPDTNTTRRPWVVWLILFVFIGIPAIVAAYSAWRFRLILR